MTIKLTDAWEGYLIYAQARGLSELTIRSTTSTINQFLGWLDADPLVDDISKLVIQKFLNHLEERGLSKRTRRNHHSNLAAIWTWMVDEGLVTEHTIRQVKPPKPEEVEVVPFSEQDIKLMLASLKRSKPYRRPRQAEASNHELPEAVRNKAIILLLLDTGIRASELCGLKISDVDLRNRRVTVFGKGAKYRMVPISAKTANALWRYQTQRDYTKPTEAFFVTYAGLRFRTNALRLMLDRLQERSGVPNIHAHRFRHTFAITYLRNGGDVFTLQRILGHSDITMTRRYSAIAASDVEVSHRAASPVANWDIG